jgi:hypothetical protein
LFLVLLYRWFPSVLKTITVTPGHVATEVGVLREHIVAA